MRDKVLGNGMLGSVQGLRRNLAAKHAPVVGRQPKLIAAGTVQVLLNLCDESVSIGAMMRDS